MLSKIARSVLSDRSIMVSQNLPQVLRSLAMPFVRDHSSASQSLTISVKVSQDTQVFDVHVSTLLTVLHSFALFQQPCFK